MKGLKPVLHRDQEFSNGTCKVVHAPSLIIETL